MKRACLILAAVAAVTGAMADELDRSWYKQPATHIPETEPYTSTYIVLQAAQRIKELYGDAE